MSASFSTATCTPSITNPIYPRPSLGPTCIQSRHVLNDNHLLIRGGSKPFEVGKSGSYSRRNLFWRQLFSSNVHDCVVALVTHGPWLHPGYCIYGFFFSQVGLLTEKASHIRGDADHMHSFCSFWCTAWGNSLLSHALAVYGSLEVIYWMSPCHPPITFIPQCVDDRWCRWCMIFVGIIWRSGHRRNLQGMPPLYYCCTVIWIYLIYFNIYI